jgi:transposase
MFIRTVVSKTSEGPTKYLQLCHNYRDKETRVSKTKVLFSFGRADRLDVDGIRRLISSLSRLLPEESALLPQETEYLGSRHLGGSWLLDQMWKRLEIDKTLLKLLKERQYETPVERLLFAMVANRALAPSSKLHMEHWVENETYVPGLSKVEVHQLYRAMDFLLEASEDIQYDIFFSVANVFNLEVDLIFLDTTTTYFEIAGEDEDAANKNGFRKRGHGKDNHPELAQVVIAFAVTREGIPVRCWVWPGNTSDQSVVEEVKKDLNTWRLGRVVLVQDTGFNSATNRRILQGAGGHYIIGEKLRLGPKGDVHEALKQKGKYRTLENGLEIKESIIGGDSEARRRYVIIRNPEEAIRDQKKREDILQEVEHRLQGLKQLDGEPHEKAACALRSHKVFGRYLRQTKAGKLRVNKSKISTEAKLDGKYLVSTSDDGLSAEDVVAGYKQLAVIERVFRDLKHLVDIRPVNHRLESRIRAHVLLCWLAILLIRVTENEVQQTWFQLKKILSTIQVGILQLPEGKIHQSNSLSTQQKALFKRLKLDLPPKFFQIDAH